MWSHSAQAIEEITREKNVAREAANQLHKLVDEAADAGSKLKTIRYLFFKAVMDDGTDTELNSACHLVVDMMEDIADKLCKLERRSWDIYRPLVEGRKTEGARQ